MLRLHRITTSQEITVADWHADLLIGLNAAMALSHLRVHADPLAAPQFEELLGPDWVVYQTGHTLGLEKDGLKLVFCDLQDRYQGFADAPMQLIMERKSLGLAVDY